MFTALGKGPRSPMMGVSGFVHVAAASPCVILRRMAAESASPLRRAVPKSLTERGVTVVTVMSTIWGSAIRTKPAAKVINSFQSQK